MAEYIDRTAVEVDFNTINVPEFGGQICISAFPGRQGGNTFCSKELALFFQYLESENYGALLSLTEVQEFEQFISFSQFKCLVGTQDFEWFFHPLVDMTFPDSAFIADFSETHRVLLQNVRAGENIALHCKGGLGRSGTIAAMLLCDLGMMAENAIKLVRSSRPGAIETMEQERFVFSHSSCPDQKKFFSA